MSKPVKILEGLLHAEVMDAHMVYTKCIEFSRYRYDSNVVK
jgi:hypothetical protein